MQDRARGGGPYPLTVPPLHRLSDLAFQTEVHHAKRARPKTGAPPDQAVINLSATIKEKADEIVLRKKRLGVFVLPTDETPEAISSDDTLFMYKNQETSVERSFLFLKDPLCFAENLFLKTPNRIMDLSMIISLALLVHDLAEKLRDSNFEVLIRHRPAKEVSPVVSTSKRK